jgi:hypothetical protein
MTKPPARSSAAKPASVPGGDKTHSLKYNPSVIAPLPLYSVYLLGMFAMRPGPARRGK